MAWVRLLAVPFAVLEVGIFKEGNYPSGYATWAWVITAALAVGAVAFLALAYRAPRRAWRTIGFTALAFDSAIVYAYIVVFAFQPGTPTRQLVFIPLVEAALRYGLLGGLVMPVISAGALALAEWFRAEQFDPGNYELDHITFPVGVQLILGMVVGWLVKSLREERRGVLGRAAEAEALRDQLGRRADLLDATNRCARALSSSLELKQAFAAFIRELRGLLPFDRTAILLLDNGQLRVLATAGEAADTLFPPGTIRPVAGSAIEEVRSGDALYSADM